MSCLNTSIFVLHVYRLKKYKNKVRFKEVLAFNSINNNNYMFFHLRFGFVEELY